MAPARKITVVADQPVYSSYRNETWFPACGHVVDGERCECSLCWAAHEAERRLGPLVMAEAT